MAKAVLDGIKRAQGGNNTKSFVTIFHIDYDKKSINEKKH